MGSFLSVVKTLLVPALISLILFLVSTFVLVPLWQRYHNRYGQYLPLESISTGTSTIRARVLGMLSPWRQRLQDRLVVARAGDDADEDYDSEDGEELSAVGDADLERGWGRHGASGMGNSDRRLNRELEEGFRDDSDEEEASGRRR